MIYRFTLLIFVLMLTSCKQDKSKNITAEEQEDVQQIQTELQYAGEADKAKIVFVSGDEEYRSEEALPQLAKILSRHHGFNCTVLFAQDPQFPGKVDPNFVYNIPGLENLADADLMVIFTRFRALPDDQMKLIDDYLKSGRPVIAMRTSTHAFMFRDREFESNYAHYGNFNDSEDEWFNGFGGLVLGEHWVSHHGNHGEQSTRGIILEQVKSHPILNSIKSGEIWGPTDVYGINLPLPQGSEVLVLGQSVNRQAERDDQDTRLGMRPTDKELPGKIERKSSDGSNRMIDQNSPMMPVAWTKPYQLPGGIEGRCFVSTMGAATDLLEEATRRMFVNAAFWCLEQEIPTKANVDIIGSYEPSKFAFHDDKHWDDLNLIIGESVK